MSTKVLKTTPKSIAIDLVLTGIAFILFTLWFSPHTPMEVPGAVNLGGIYTALPGTAVFFFLLQMFKVVYVYQKKLNSKK